MSSVKVVLNRDVVKSEILQGEGTQQLLLSLAEEQAARAGDGYSASIHLTEQRAIATVYPDTQEAEEDNSDNNTLFRSIGG